MNNIYPTLNAYKDHRILPVMYNRAEAILKEFPMVSIERSVELAAAELMNAYDAEYADFLNAVPQLIQEYGHKVVNEFKFDIMDREELDGGVFNMLINASGNRSALMDREELKNGGVAGLLERQQQQSEPRYDRDPWNYVIDAIYGEDE